jgi:hypothetical protein
MKTGEEAEAWLLGLKKYFQVYDYSETMKSRVGIFNMNGRETIQWEDVKRIKRISERKVTWEKFKKYFQHKYLLERYYDGKVK